MKKIIFALFGAALLLIGAGAYSLYQKSALDELEEKPLAPLAEGELREADQKGSLEEIAYPTQDEDGNSVTKTALVYLPWGYEENIEKRYDILYLMHGWYMDETTLLTSKDPDIKNLIDRMIEEKEVAPLIVVTPTFDLHGETEELDVSLDEVGRFHEEFRRDLVPAVESRYRTYAESGEEQALADSRGHRAFSGFSMGAAVTWDEILNNADLISAFLPVAAGSWEKGVFGGYDEPEETAEDFELALNEQGIGSDDFRILAASGTDEPMYDAMRPQIEAMLNRRIFTNKNVSFSVLEGGAHDLNLLASALKSLLPEIFPAF